MKTSFRFCRFCVRCLTPRYRVRPANESVAPAVYIVQHRNLRGPIVSMIWFNSPVRLWVLSVFCSQNACFRQYYDYTFTKRFGMPKMLAFIAAFPLSFCIPGLIRLIRAIPVFRGSKAIVQTLKESITTLSDGENLLLCPDVDYTDTGSDIGEMYKGFLVLEKYYMKQTGKHLAFVPLYISKPKHCIYTGEPVYFNSDVSFGQEKLKVHDRLKQEFFRLKREADQ